jgi:hypothetical protein
MTSTAPARPEASRPGGARHVILTWALWTAGFVAFPVAGLAGTAVAGRVDDPLAAALGGAVAGLVIGAAQALLSRRRLPPLQWCVATGVGMGLGLLLGAVAVGYRTGLGDLAVQGGLTGLVLGPAQALALPGGTERRRRWLWAAAAPVLWALGWTATTLGGIDVESHYTVFGAYGALTYSALAGLLLIAVLPRTPADVSPHARHRRSP